jgi:hypothetical protein
MSKTPLDFGSMVVIFFCSGFFFGATSFLTSVLGFEAVCARLVFFGFFTSSSGTIEICRIW